MSKTTIHTLYDQFLSQNLSLPEIYHALNLRHGINMDTDEEPPTAGIVPSYDARLWQIERFMRHIEKGDVPPFEIRKTIRIIDQFINGSMGWIDTWLHDFRPTFWYSPHVELFFVTTISFPESISCQDYPLAAYARHDLASMANNYIATLRANMQTRPFKEKIRHREENATRTFVKSTQYMDALFDHHRRMVVLRLDFNLSNDPSKQERDPLEPLLRHVSSLRDLMQRKVGVFEHLVGYIARVEYGVKKGHHLHALFFFDGDHVRHYYGLAKCIVEQWHKLTNGHGLYFNTQEKFIQYRCKAIGMIERENTEMRQCLAYVIWYITKLDQFLPYKYSDKQRLLFRGEIKHKNN